MTKKKKKIALINASVLTMDQKLPSAWGVLITGGLIEQLLPVPTSTRNLRSATVIDCKGNSLLPGFIDIHCHLRSYAEALLSLDLSPRSNIKSIEDMKRKIWRYTKALPPGTWIKARNYDEFYLEEKRHPTRFDLDAVSPEHPVKLTHRTGMVHVLNSLALKAVGIFPHSEDPEDGLIDRDPRTGEPTGVLYGMARFLSQRIPGRTKEEVEMAMKKVNDHLISSGVTSICDASSYNNLTTARAFREWIDKGVLMPRVSLMLGIEGFHELSSMADRDITGWKKVRIAGIKVIIHETTGRLLPEKKFLETLVKRIHEKGYPVAIHAFEEDQIMAAIDCIRATRSLIPQRRPDRIEHCAVCTPEILDLIRQLRIAIVSQPSFLYLNGDRYCATIPEERRNWLYPFRSIDRSGILFAASSDFPIGDPNPLISLYSLITRKTLSGVTLGREESVSMDRALFFHTVAPAKVIGESDRLGSISAGKLADLVVLDRDLRKIAPEELPKVKVSLTVIGGKVVYCSGL